MDNFKDATMKWIVKYHGWSFRRLDKKISRKVAEEYGAKRSLGNYNKLLWYNVSMKRIADSKKEATTYVLENSKPWLDDSTRIIPTSLYLDVSMGIFDRKSNWLKVCHEEFVDNYEDNLKKTEKQLGLAFNIDDYPDDGNVLYNKFNLTSRFESVTSDFRTDLSDELNAELKAGLEKEYQRGYEIAQMDNWKLIKRAVGRMAETFGSGKSFHRTIITNVEDVVRIIPKLNILGDKRLDDMVLRIRSRALKYTWLALKESVSKQNDVKFEATKILYDIEQMFGDAV